MTCPRCQGFTYELLISDEWAEFRQSVCVNCGWRYQREPTGVRVERSAGKGSLFQPPLVLVR